MFLGISAALYCDVPATDTHAVAPTDIHQELWRHKPSLVMPPAPIVWTDEEIRQQIWLRELWKTLWAFYGFLSMSSVALFLVYYRFPPVQPMRQRDAGVTN